MTSLSFVRVQDDLDDWLKWHHGAPEFTLYDDPLGEDDDEDAYRYVPGDEDDEEDVDPAPVGGFGWHVAYDFTFPQAGQDASDRYWESMKALRSVRDTMCEAGWTVDDELNPSAADTA